MGQYGSTQICCETERESERERHRERERESKGWWENQTKFIQPWLLPYPFVHRHPREGTLL
jgi:hypothetical protein